MIATAASTPADEVVQIVEDLHAFIDARMKVHPALAGMLFYIFERLGRLRNRLVRFAARLRTEGSPRPRAHGATSAGTPRRVRTPIQWPRKYRGLADMLGYEAEPFADRLRALLANPDAVAFVVANPGIGRYLRPLCQGFGIPLIPELRLKRRTRFRAIPVGRISKAPSDTGPGTAIPANPAQHIPTPPPPHPPAPMPVIFFPSEDDPPMAVRVARHLARRRIWLG